MKVAVINEVSARDKNPDIVKALSHRRLEVHNVGMIPGDNQVELTYIHTGLMAAILLNLGVVDLVVGGCGTGQGFLNSAMQYPNVFCGLLIDPLDGFLFSQINNGNCISLALNKEYGWAGDVNLKYIFDRFFEAPPGQGYPEARKDSQRNSRTILSAISKASHRSLVETLQGIDPSILKTIMKQKPFLDLINQPGSNQPLHDFLMKHRSVK
ncbi:MAG: RpiB/LacA/LacB family sugar-phosphate isomerase [Bacilli bacterium]|jgi:ribose 5-phosphate isomerase RpiB